MRSGAKRRTHASVSRPFRDVEGPNGLRSFCVDTLQHYVLPTENYVFWRTFAWRRRFARTSARAALPFLLDARVQ